MPRGLTATAWVLLLLAFLHPASGTSLVVCPSRLLLQTPCPGCGLTRSLSCAVRGGLRQSVQHHPFGPLLAAAAVAVAALSLAPASVQARVVSRLALSGRARRVIAAALLGGLLLFGVLRAAM